MRMWHVCARREMHGGFVGRSEGKNNLEVFGTDGRILLKLI
jgi:hypothetical protein